MLAPDLFLGTLVNVYELIIIFSLCPLFIIFPHGLCVDFVPGKFLWFRLLCLAALLVPNSSNGKEGIHK